MFSAEQILQPVSATHPGGSDLAFSPELDAIAQARQFDDPSLDQGEWVTELKEADWGFVVQRCAALLETRSKDLRLAVWLAEAAARQHHLRGLAEGFRVLAGLCEDYWYNGLFPESDGDNEQRVGNLSWILARTPALLRAIPLTEGRGSAYSMVDFETARKQAANGGPPPGGLKLADLEAARRNSSPQFREALATDAAACMEALQAFEKAADARLGDDSPGFSAAREALQALIHVLPPSAVNNGAVQVADEGVAMNDSGQAIHAEEGSIGQIATIHLASSSPPGAIQNRTQAVAQLRLVAQFFRRTEPHSPVSYFADKAADAADQDLHSWLRSVVKDQASMDHIEELLGVKGRPRD
ncbi:type VI secretion system protein TssA [Pseudoduganella namucuonensis]|uniref:Type VI secretion system protein ImpA n=1 Tax=Pseudoduganella namucuonensis TaxID=1035707 RepID=A0A1I7JF67_9BURK|nr:type VI secretion system protein TssA [Pseudoduganella namucuonensis]SFU83831.1 type VI secretion system protein ImpA [Pseudoduganella namucuonensis]